MPKYLEVSEWCKDWAGEKSADFIKNAFVLTGLVPVREFDVSNLHTPLKLCYDEKATEKDLIDNGFVMAADIDSDSASVHWEFFAGPGSFYHVLHVVFEPTTEKAAFLRNIAQRLLVTIDSHVHLKPILDAEEKKAILDGKITDSGIEIVAASLLFKSHFKVVEIDAHAKVMSEGYYEYETGANKVVVAKLENMFGVDSSFLADL